jgi:predicted metalloprotease with PDZ domain
MVTLVTAVPTKKSSIQSGDRILEINGVGYLDFKSEKKANELFDMLILDVIPADEDDEEEEESEEEESSDDEELD